MLRNITSSEARDEFAEVINRVAYGGERIVIRRREKELAAVVPMEDLCLLESLIEQEEDRIDAEASRNALADPDDEVVSWEEARKEIGL